MIDNSKTIKENLDKFYEGIIIPRIDPIFRSTNGTYGDSIIMLIDSMVDPSEDVPVNVYITAISNKESPLSILSGNYISVYQTSVIDFSEVDYTLDELRKKYAESYNVTIVRTDTPGEFFRILIHFS